MQALGVNIHICSLSLSGVRLIAACRPDTAQGQHPTPHKDHAAEWLARLLPRLLQFPQRWATQHAPPSGCSALQIW